MSATGAAIAGGAPARASTVHTPGARAGIAASALALGAPIIGIAGKQGKAESFGSPLSFIATLSRVTPWIEMRRPCCLRRCGRVDRAAAVGLYSAGIFLFGAESEAISEAAAPVCGERGGTVGRAA